MSSISRKNFGRTTQVRHLPIRERNALIEILENEEAWKRVMACVRRTPTERLPCPIKYTNRHLEIVEAAANPPYRRCSEIFLKEWGCSGPKLPTLHDLLELVMEAEVYRAAYYVAVEILHESPPARPKTGLAALVTVPLEFQNPSLVSPTAPPVSDNRSESSQTNFEFLTQVETVQATSPSTNDKSEILKLEDDALTVGQLETVLVEQSPMRTPLQFSSYSSYSFLQSITNGFNDNSVGESGGRMLGKGGFGSVYLGIHDNHYTAIKKLYNNNNFDAYRVFDNEVKTLLGLEHPNLLHMIAYCSDGPANCVVYDYMWEGDLQERLSLEGRWKIPLTHSARMTIALGTSEGLKYLHEDHKPPLVHRDIGDFGLARFGDLGDQTSTVIGTDCYMSPEAMSGDVSVKIDVFSFGVVLLELLTSLSPMKPYGDGLDLIFYVRETCDKSIAVLLDKGAGNWMDKSGTDLSEQLYVIAQQCLEDDKDERPLISAVVQSLRFLLSDSEITCHSNIDPL